MTQFYQDQVAAVIERKATAYEAGWLRNFNLGYREARDIQLFPIAEGHPFPLTTDYFSVQHPTALMIFEGAFVRQVEGHRLEDFTRGAATVAALFGEAQASRAMDLIREQLDAMYERVYQGENPYPRLDSSLALLYAACVNLVLLGEEVTTWRPMLSYTCGALWMCGFAKGSDKYFRRVQFQAEEILAHYARMGTYCA